MHSISGSFKETRPAYQLFEGDKALVETFDFEWLHRYTAKLICDRYNMSMVNNAEIEWEPVLWDLMGKPRLWIAKHFDYKISYIKDI
jgi:hypothetical protein